MSVLITNNAASRLASSITAVATSLSVTAGEGSRFPSPTGSQWFPVTVVKSSGVREIMRCTARSGDILTVTRGQEGTAATTFSAGDVIELRITAAAFAEFKQTDTISTFMQGMLDDADAVAARATLGLNDGSITQKQTSPTDLTAGRLLIQGAFGLGAAVNLGAGADLNWIVDSGFYRLGDGVLSGPTSFGASFGQLIVSRGGDTILQIVADFGGNFAMRSGNPASVGGGGSFSPWRTLYHTGNVSSFIQTLLDDANADAARDTLGAASGPLTISTSTSNSNSGAGHSHALSLSNNDIATRVAALGAGDVGTYAYCRNVSGAQHTEGQVVSGSVLRYGGGEGGGAGGTPSGSWRVMGNVNNGFNTLYLRIS